MAQITAGPRNPNGKLDWEKVREIRSLYKSGWSQGRIAREFYVSINTIARVVRGESWQEPGMVLGREMTEEELQVAAKASYEKLQERLKDAPAERKFTYGKFGEKIYDDGIPHKLSLKEIMRREAEKDEGAGALEKLDEATRELGGGLGEFLEKD